MPYNVQYNLPIRLYNALYILVSCKVLPIFFFHVFFLTLINKFIFFIFFFFNQDWEIPLILKVFDLLIQLIDLCLTSGPHQYMQ